MSNWSIVYIACTLDSTKLVLYNNPVVLTWREFQELPTIFCNLILIINLYEVLSACHSYGNIHCLVTSARDSRQVALWNLKL